VTYLGLIERSEPSALDRILSRPKWNRQEEPAGHSAAAKRFAASCAALGGTTMLRDLLPDIVTVSFGSRTNAIHAQLQARGWTSIGKGAWQGEPVLGVRFGRNRLGAATADELVRALTRILGEMEIAEARVW
jgi:hypothetical protein